MYVHMYITESARECEWSCIYVLHRETMRHMFYCDTLDIYRCIWSALEIIVRNNRDRGEGAFIYDAQIYRRCQSHCWCEMPEKRQRISAGELSTLYVFTHSHKKNTNIYLYICNMYLLMYIYIIHTANLMIADKMFELKY